MKRNNPQKHGFDSKKDKSNDINELRKHFLQHTGYDTVLLIDTKEKTTDISLQFWSKQTPFYSFIDIPHTNIGATSSSNLISSFI